MLAGLLDGLEIPRRGIPKIPGVLDAGNTQCKGLRPIQLIADFGETCGECAGEKTVKRRRFRGQVYRADISNKKEALLIETPRFKSEPNRIKANVYPM